MASRPVFPRRLAVVLFLLFVIGLAGPGWPLVSAVVGGVVKGAAAGRGFDASWRSFRFVLPAGFHATGFTLAARDRGDTLLAADTLAMRLSVSSLLLFRPQLSAVTLTHARVALPRRGGGADPDTLEPARDDPPTKDGPAAPRVTAAAGTLVRTLLLPARRMPRLAWRDVTIETAPAGPDEPARVLALRWLELTPESGGVSLSASGTFGSERRVPFEIRGGYGADDRITGGARLVIHDPETRRDSPLQFSIAGRVVQDRAASEVRALEPMTVTVGRLPFRIEGAARLSGPAFSFRLEADSVTDGAVRASLPPPVLGPLVHLATRGSFDYRLALDLDLAAPDSVRFHADVIPNGLALDGSGTRMRILGLEQPFVASVYLPKDRIEFRDLSEQNPHYRPLDDLDSLLVRAVLTNEDGGFYRHRGFSEEAVRGAIAYNLRAGAFRRGAGTITMQLARNLYLGHERTLPRKGQEVILAWVLEHLAGVSKRRLLEIYMNVIEWGPGVHGADEAAQFYFGRGARNLSIDESLFLTILIPSPSKWRWRLDAEGRLRPFARAQMHFIGRAMVAKGWLRAEELPPEDQLEIRIRGDAWDLLFPRAGGEPDTVSAGRAESTAPVQVAQNPSSPER